MKGWRPPTTQAPKALVISHWIPSYLTLQGNQSTTEATTSTSSISSTASTTTVSIETVDIDYDEFTTPLPTITSISVTSEATVESFEDLNEQDFDDRFDFDENLFAPIESEEDNFDFSQMANDFVEYESEEEIEEFVTRSPRVTKPRIVNNQPVRDIIDENAQFDLASLGVQSDGAVTINIFNNQVYNQNASGTARLVNNHGQDLTFGDKFGSGVIPPGANVGQRGQIRHMVEELVKNGHGEPTQQVRKRLN